MHAVKNFVKSVVILSLLLPTLLIPSQAVAAENNPINPAPINIILRLNSICGGVIRFSIDMQNMPSDWVDAVARAGNSWASAGSNMTIGNGSSQEEFTPLDYNGNPIEADGKVLTLKKCEVRVFRASSLGGKYIVSLEDALARVPVNDPRTLNLAGWAQQFTSDGSTADAAFVVLNDRNSTKSLSTNPAPGIFDVESIALHEIGHTLGLGHISEPLAVMNGDALDHLLGLVGVSRRDLTPADIDALVSLFGKSG